MWERTHEMGSEPQSMYETCKDQGRRSILDDFLGDHGATAYEAIASKFLLIFRKYKVTTNKSAQMRSVPHPRSQVTIRNPWMVSPSFVEIVI